MLAIIFKYAYFQHFSSENVLHTENKLHQYVAWNRDVAPVWIFTVTFQHHGQSCQSITVLVEALRPEG